MQAFQQRVPPSKRTEGYRTPAGSAEEKNSSIDGSRSSTVAAEGAVKTDGKPSIAPSLGARHAGLV